MSENRQRYHKLGILAWFVFSLLKRKADIFDRVFSTTRISIHINLHHCIKYGVVRKLDIALKSTEDN